MTNKKTAKPEDVHVGQRVRARRIMIEMSQEKLAEALGITFQQIQKYEKGTNRIGASRLVEIARALKVKVSFFFEGIDVQGDITVADQALMNFMTIPGAVRLSRSFIKMTPAGRHALQSTADAINGASGDSADVSLMAAE